MNSVLLFYMAGAAVIALASIAIIIYAVYQMKRSDVISVDDVGMADFVILKKLAKDKPALHRIGEEYDADLYNDL